MTREEAVNELNDKIKSAEYVDSDYIDCVSVDVVKMAISALSVPETNVGDTISRQAAIGVVHKWLESVFGVDSTDDSIGVFKRLRKLPTIDEVEIVRCKDCRHRVDDDAFVSGHICMLRRENGGRYCEDDDFCSYAERSEDETD